MDSPATGAIWGTLATLVCASLLGCGQSASDDPFQPKVPSGTSTIVVILRPNATLSSGFMPRGGSTVHGCVDEVNLQSPPPVGNGQDTTFATATANVTRAMAFGYPPIGISVGTVRRVTLRVSCAALAAPHRPPSPWAWELYLHHNGHDFYGTSSGFAPNTTLDVVLQEATIDRGLDIPVVDFDAIQVVGTVLPLFIGPSVEHRVWSYEIELEIESP